MEAKEAEAAPGDVPEAVVDGISRLAPAARCAPAFQCVPGAQCVRVVPAVFPPGVDGVARLGPLAWPRAVAETEAEEEASVWMWVA
jgi:hypothetical protein